MPPSGRGSVNSLSETGKAGERAAKARRIGKRDFFDQFPDDDDQMSQGHDDSDAESNAGSDFSGSSDGGPAAVHPLPLRYSTATGLLPGRQIILHKGHCRSDSSSAVALVDTDDPSSTRALRHPLVRPSGESGRPENAP
eukprot:TRINITY_DN2787_c2_g1_i1.p2 TRINITY_DN2787_c2_g1~~TRINITY_DN2787_c2_g1_i1.p2  ORF type:complete len:139 (+),score=1.11 TRINITY_DN2787_c2_g1_i1:198-614(+)